MQFYFHLPRGNEYQIGEHSKIYSQIKLAEFEHIGTSYHYIIIIYAICTIQKTNALNDKSPFVMIFVPYALKTAYITYYLLLVIFLKHLVSTVNIE